MKAKLILALTTLLLSVPALRAREVFVPLSTVETRIDGARLSIRLFNPTRDAIRVTASTFICPAATACARGVLFELSVPPRQMVIRDVAFSSLSERASQSLVLTSDGDFDATVKTSRPAAERRPDSMLPQVDRAGGAKRGVFVQLAGDAAIDATSVIGFTNPGLTGAAVTLKLFDRGGAVIREGNLTVPAGSTREWDGTTLFTLSPAELASGWLEFDATEPLLGYAAVSASPAGTALYVEAVADRVIGPLAGSLRRRAARHVFLPDMPDLSVATTVSTTTPKAGDNVTYTVTAINQGPGSLSGLQIEFVLPSSVTFQSATPSSGSYDASTRRWTVSSLASGSTATLAVVGKTSAGSQDPVEACAFYVTSTPADPNISNNRSCSSITVQPAQQAAKTLEVVAFRFAYSVTPSVDLHVGDQITLNIRTSDVSHGFALLDPNGNLVGNINVTFSAGQVVTRSFTPTIAGTYPYFCTVSSCGRDHGSMQGSFTITAP